MQATPRQPINCGRRVVHNCPTRNYGRGVIRHVDHTFATARVEFDGDGGIPRTVRLRDLTPEPVEAPVRRLLVIA